jgi:A/G-specific adenine glycosylase
MQKINTRTNQTAGIQRSHPRDRSRLPRTDELRYFRRSLLRWYRLNGRDFPWRKKSVSIYRLIVTEALLQRTKAETVAAFYHEFFRRFPSWAILASVSETELGQCIKPIGLWRRRAATLSRLASIMVARHGHFPRIRSQVEELPGVGQYVANAVSLFAHASPAPLLDGGMARVLERYFGPRRLADIRYDPYLQALAWLVIAIPRCKELNWAILDFAALVCRPSTPACPECPLRTTCRFRRSKRTGRLMRLSIAPRSQHGVATSNDEV